MKQALILHGPNLNMLGVREPDIYGAVSLDDINARLQEESIKLGLQLRFFQSNHEGVLIDQLQEAAGWASGVVFNPAGYTHTSVALRDAIAAIQIPVIEVHLSNVSGRESFRQVSLTAPVCRGTVAGFGWRSYLYALHALVELIAEE
ncbi:MAG: type II 3-dehydroquinate dehydratase [Anaerolineaceae bacterium]|nr:type II 3-dehydroquinate dehydratase [Anaerolineaceae bacterium]